MSATQHQPIRITPSTEIGPFYAACNLNTDYKATIRTENCGHLTATLEVYGQAGVKLASVFAAAPELLGSAKNAVYWALRQHAIDVEEGKCTLNPKPGWILSLQAAIAKAEGRV